MSQDSNHIAVFGYGPALKRHLKGRAALHSDLSMHYRKATAGRQRMPTGARTKPNANSPRCAPSSPRRRLRPSARTPSSASLSLASP